MYPALFEYEIIKGRNAEGRLEMRLAMALGALGGNSFMEQNRLSQQNQRFLSASLHKGNRTRIGLLICSRLVDGVDLFEALAKHSSTQRSSLNNFWFDEFENHCFKKENKESCAKLLVSEMLFLSYKSCTYSGGGGQAPCSSQFRN